MSGPEENKTLVRRFMAAFSAGDVKTVGEIMHPDGTWWVAGAFPLSGTYTREEFLKLLGQVTVALKGPIKLTPKAFTAESNRVAVETDSLAHTNSGRTYANQYHFLFEIRDNKILRIKEYLDTMHANAILCTP